MPTEARDATKDRPMRASRATIAGMAKPSSTSFGELSRAMATAWGLRVLKAPDAKNDPAG